MERVTAKARITLSTQTGLHGGSRCPCYLMQSSGSGRRVQKPQLAQKTEDLRAPTQAVSACRCCLWHRRNDLFFNPLSGGPHQHAHSSSKSKNSRCHLLMIFWGREPGIHGCSLLSSIWKSEKKKCKLEGSYLVRSLELSKHYPSSGSLFFSRKKKKCSLPTLQPSCLQW